VESHREDGGAWPRPRSSNNLRPDLPAQHSSVRASLSSPSLSPFLTRLGTDCTQDLLSAFEAAAASQPGDQGLLESLFLACVREGALVKQQAAAMRIYRAEPTERHLLWVVASLLSQARAARDAGAEQAASSTPTAPPASPAGTAPPIPGAQLLALAEGMLKRAADGGLLRTQAGLSVYLTVLASLNRHGDATALAASPLAATCTAIESERLRCVAELAGVSGDWALALESNEALLKANPDDWLAFCGAADAKTALAGVSVKDMEPGADGDAPTEAQIDPAAAAAAADAVATLAVRLAEAGSAAGGPKVVGRGPWLALVESAHRRLMLLSRSGGHSGDAVIAAAAEALGVAVATHWQQFGDSPSAAADLALYARALRRHPRGADALCRMVASHSDSAAPHATKEAADKALRRASVAMALRVDCGAVDGMAIADVCRDAVALAAAAREAGPLVRNVTDIREGTSGDACFHLAAESLALRAAAGATSTAPPTEPHDITRLLLSALLLAKEGSTISTHAAPLRVTCATIYGLLGAADAAADALAPLNLRQVQHESLAHIVQPPHFCTSVAPTGVSQPLLAAMSTFHAASHEPGGGAGDMTVSAMLSGAADKALDFDAFARRLRDSHGRAVCETETRLAAVVTAALAAGSTVHTQFANAAADLAPLVSAAALDRLRFNADDGVNPRFLALPSGGWHAAVADWWSACATATPHHAWPVTRPVMASLRGAAHEGGGPAQRKRSAAALALRSSVVEAFGSAMLCAPPALRTIADRAVEAAQSLARNGGRMLASDTATLLGLSACAAVATVCCENGAADAGEVCTAAVQAWASALSEAVGVAEAALKAGAFPLESPTLPLTGGALNHAAAAATALGIASAAMTAWTQTSSSLSGGPMSKKRVAVIAPHLRTLAATIKTGAAALSSALCAASLASSEEQQIGGMRVAMEALPVCEGVPPATVDAVAAALVTSHRAAAQRLVDRAKGLVTAASGFEARAQKG
jgi:hypothetical protein